MMRLKVSKPCKIVPKGWGREVWIANNSKYCGKILEFNPNSKLSLHYHSKEEHFFVTEGEFTLIGRDKLSAETYTLELKPGDVVEIPSLHVHQLSTVTGGTIVEVSTPDNGESFRISPGDSQK